MLPICLACAVLGIAPGSKVDLTSYASSSSQLSFTQNSGQWSSAAKFVARGDGFNYWLTSTGFVYDLFRDTGSGAARRGITTPKAASEPGTRTGQAIQVEFIGASAGARFASADQKEDYVNYFRGKDPSKWVRGVHKFGVAAVRGLYPGIDLVAHFDPSTGRPSYDFILYPGADASKIRMRYTGADSVSINRNGEVALQTRFGEVTERGLTAFQPTATWSPKAKALTPQIPVRARLNSDGTVGFNLTNSDPNRLRVIDPILWSTYDGGSGQDVGTAMAMVGQDTAYAGSTDSVDLPGVFGRYQVTKRGLVDAYVTSLGFYGYTNWTTYLGGSSDDQPFDMASDAAGNLYVTGYTNSQYDYPTTPGAYQSHALSYANNSEVFVTKLSPDGKNLVYSSSFGDKQVDAGRGIAVDADGAAYIAGWTGSRKFPVTAGCPQPIHGGGDFDAFASKLSPDGSTLVWSTFLGGNDDDEALGIAVDSAKNAYVCGFAISSNFPTTAGSAQPISGGGAQYGDGFVTKIAPTGTSVAFSSMIGGTGDDAAETVAVDATGSAYVAGTTLSADFPVKAGCLQTTYAGGDAYGGDGFVVKFSPSGSQRLWSTYIGGSAGEEIIDLRLDANKNIYLAGDTGSANFPVTVGAYQTRYGGGSADGFLSKMNPGGTALTSSTLLGGSQGDITWRSGLDTSGNMHAIGWTGSADFPCTALNTRGFLGGGVDGFVVKLSAGASSVPPGPQFVYVPDGSEVIGGEPVTEYIQLTSTVSADSTVKVNSSNAGLIPSFSTIVPAGQSFVVPVQATKMVKTGPAVVVKLTNIAGGKQIIKNVTVHPFFLFGLSTSMVTGGSSVTGTITLHRAYFTDTVLTVSDNSANASAPVTVTIPAGSLTGNFTIQTTTPAAATVAKITVQYVDCKQIANLTINP